MASTDVVFEAELESAFGISAVSTDPTSTDVYGRSDVRKFLWKVIHLHRKFTATNNVGYVLTAKHSLTIEFF